MKKPTVRQKRAEDEARDKRLWNLGNIVEYMAERSWSRTFPQGYEFLGWKECDECGWGVDIGGKNFCAVHVFDTSTYAGPGKTPFCWGDDPHDTEPNAEANPWVLMFYGSDNSSWFSRHATKEDAIEAFHNTRIAEREHLMFYNS